MSWNLSKKSLVFTESRNQTWCTQNWLLLHRRGTLFSCKISCHGLGTWSNATKLNKSQYRQIRDQVRASSFYFLFSAAVTKTGCWTTSLWGSLTENLPMLSLTLQHWSQERSSIGQPRQCWYHMYEGRVRWGQFHSVPSLWDPQSPCWSLNGGWGGDGCLLNLQKMLGIFHVIFYITYYIAQNIICHKILLSNLIC